MTGCRTEGKKLENDFGGGAAQSADVAGPSAAREPADAAVVPLGSNRLADGLFPAITLIT